MPLLWKHVSTKDTSSPSCTYIFGTMHSATPAAVDYLPRVKGYIDQCSEYYGESDLSHPLLTHLEHKEIKAWTGLKAHLSQAAYDKAHRLILTKCALDLDHIQTMPPMILQTIISEHALPHSAHQPLDLILWQYAERKALTLCGIESAEEQHAIYKKIPLDYQLKQLKNSVTHLSKSGRQLKSLAQAYKEEDLTKLYRLSKRTLGPVRTLLLTLRNQTMAARISQITQKGNHTFISIGAAHLPGVTGVLRLLKREGIVFKPMTFV